MAGALDDIERLKELMSRVTDGRGIAILPSGTGTTPVVEGGAHVLYGSKHIGSLKVTNGGGLNAAYESGQVRLGTDDADFYLIAAGIVALTNTATNYVFVDNTGVVAANTTGFPSDGIMLAKAVAAGGVITSITDRRAYLAAGGGGTGPHDILSVTHTDTLASAVSRGSLIVGNLTPAWAELVIGGANTILGSDGTDVDWRAQSFIDHGSIGGLADNDHTQYVLRSILTTNGDLFVRLAGAVDRLGVGAAPDGYVLTLASGLPAWASIGITQYTDEMAEDAVGGILLDTASIDFTYNDAGNTISAVVLAAGVDHGGLGGLADDDHTQYVLRSILTTRGDLYYRNATIVTRLGIGANTQILGTDGIDPIWESQSFIDHGSIGGLVDDDHTSYAQLAGRAGGQTLEGGTAASESLILRSTHHATKGSVKIGATLFEADEAGTKIGFFGVSPVVRASAYTPTNVTTDRTYNADATTIDELADILGTLIADLTLYGLLQS